jgi:hypothetical protein|tara:strand:- start:258 stop:548 length:291 start_codon:yes stop_codon:yes gene_type:complete
MNDLSDTTPFDEGTPDIVLVGIDQKSYYMYKGDEFLNQLLLVDGAFPKPVLCKHFQSIFDARMALGDDFSLVSCWGIHPEIFERLRNDGCLIEENL